MSFQYMDSTINIANELGHFCVAFERQLRRRNVAQG